MKAFKRKERYSPFKGLSKTRFFSNILFFLVFLVATTSRFDSNASSA
nr:hypothetical protein HPHPH23_1529 [Helicobacter pylori Hp H-23]